MRFRDKENELMWERYTGHSYAQDPHADNSGEEQQQKHFNRQNTNPLRKPRAFDYSDENTQADVNTYFSSDNQDHGAGGFKRPQLRDTNFSEEEAEDETIVLGLEPEGPVEIDNGFDLAPDTDDSDGFGDMMEVEEEPEDEIDEVLYSDIKKLAEYSNRLLKDVDHGELETWMIAKIIKASEYVSDVWHRLDAKADFANTGVDQVEDDEFGM
jgi:hypothetical protein